MTRGLDEIYADIVARPEFDDPRLEYALACQQSAPQYSAYISRSLRHHEFGYYNIQIPDELFDRYAAPLFAAGANGCGFHRGFIEDLYVDPSIFIDRGERLLELAPIITVHLRTRHAGSGGRAFPIREIASCPHLKRVRRLVLTTEHFDRDSLDILVESPNLDSLISIATPSLYGSPTKPHFSEDELKVLWRAIYSSAAFRRICNYGLYVRARSLFPYGENPLDGLGVPNPFADSFSYVEDSDQRYWNVSYIPMIEEGRELERIYGYIPSLHVENWDADVLEVMRGQRPAFAPGTAPVEAMYGVPAPERVKAIPGERE